MPSAMVSNMFAVIEKLELHVLPLGSAFNRAGLALHNFGSPASDVA